MKRFKRNILLFFMGALIIVLTSFSVIFFSFNKQVDLQDVILRTEKNIMNVDSLITIQLQMESDKRAFQLTSDFNFLKKYSSTKTLSGKCFETLYQNCTDPADIKRVGKLEVLMQTRHKNLDSGLFLFRFVSQEAAVSFMQLPENIFIRDQLDTELESLKKYFVNQFLVSTKSINNYSRINKGGLLVLLLVFITIMVTASLSFKITQQRVLINHFKFKEAQRIARIGSWEWNFANGKLKWSQEQFKIFGQERGKFNLTFDSYLDHFKKEDQLKIREMIIDVTAGKGQFEFEHELMRKDGSITMVHEQGTVLYDKKGEAIGLFGTTQDITDRLNAGKELLKAQKEFKEIFDNSADGIYRSTKDGQFIMANKSMAKIFGYDTPEELICSIKDIGSQIYADPEDRKRMSELISQQGHIENYEMQVLTKTGKPIWVSANISIGRNDNGDFKYFEGTLEDISERKNAEAEILQLNKSLEQFANITAHDLQEPIRMVSGFLGLLDKKYSSQLDEQARSYIDRAKDGADRMTILIRDLLEYSRSGNKNAKKGFVNLSSVVELVQNDMSIVMADTAADMYVQNNLPIVEGTESALYRLFLNLVSNGIKFRKKDIPPHVEICIDEEQDYWKFTVRDNGIGVKESDQDKLFKAFQRLHGKGEYPGTGLGLVTCKKIVETHGGKIWMTSEYGKGTAFHFTLPKLRA